MLNDKAYKYFPLHFKGTDNAYCYEVPVLFFTDEGKEIGYELMHSKWFKKDAAIGTIDFAFDIPKNTAFYLLCLRLHGGKNGVVTGHLASEGMGVVKAGKVSD